MIHTLKRTIEEKVHDFAKTVISKQAIAPKMNRASLALSSGYFNPYEYIYILFTQVLISYTVDLSLPR